MVGGDGTLNEAVNGMLESGRDLRQTPLAVVPAGNGNDFAKPLGLPVGDPRAAARLVLHGRRRSVDVGCLNGRWFVNGVGMGLDGRVALETRGLRRLRGKPMYAVALLRALRAHRAAHMAIVADGHDQDVAATMVNVTNGPCHGGGFWICPHARIDDGALDLCLARAMAPLRVAWLALLVTRGAHVGHPLVSFRTASSVTVNSRAPLPVHVDGEVLGSGLTSLEIQVLPGRLHVLVPR